MRVSVVTTIDVAVGCPFGGEERGGRVLIFNGNRDVSTHGLTLSQELRAAWTHSDSLPGYGFTLRGGQDLDSNQYPGIYSYSNKSSLLYSVPHVLIKTLSLTYIPSPLLFPSSPSHFSLPSLHSWPQHFMIPPMHPSTNIPMFSCIAFLLPTSLLKSSVRGRGYGDKCQWTAAASILQGFTVFKYEGKHTNERKKDL